MIPELITAIQTELQTATSVEVKPGVPSLEEGAVPRRDVGYIYCPSFSRGENAIWEVTEIRVRLYQQYIEPRSDEEPVDPMPLYALGELLRDAIADRRRLTDSTGQVWLITLAGVEFGHDEQYAEAVYGAGRENRFETAETVG